MTEKDRFVFYGSTSLNFAKATEDAIEAIHYFGHIAPLYLLPRFEEDKICIRITVERVEKEETK